MSLIAPPERLIRSAVEGLVKVVLAISYLVEMIMFARMNGSPIMPLHVMGLGKQPTIFGGKIFGGDVVGSSAGSEKQGVTELLGKPPHTTKVASRSGAIPV